MLKKLFGVFSIHTIPNGTKLHDTFETEEDAKKGMENIVQTRTHRLWSIIPAYVKEDK